MRLKNLAQTTLSLQAMLESYFEKTNFSVGVSSRRHLDSFPAQDQETLRTQFYDAMQAIEHQTNSFEDDPQVQAAAESWTTLYNDWIVRNYKAFLPLEKALCHYNLAYQLAKRETKLYPILKNTKPAKRIVDKLLNTIPKKVHKDFLVVPVDEPIDSGMGLAFLCGDILYLNQQLLLYSKYQVLFGAIANEISRAQTKVVLGGLAVPTFNRAFFGSSSQGIDDAFGDALAKKVENESNAGAVILVCGHTGSVDSMIRFLEAQHAASSARERRLIYDDLQRRIQRVRKLASQTEGCSKTLESEAITQTRNALFE